MKPPNLAEASIWSAALMAANCRAVNRPGSQVPVRWRRGRDSMRYVARTEVEVEPLGVHLGPGDVLEVRWEPNQTGYTLQVLSAPTAA
jgi:hypothetical protein